MLGQLQLLIQEKGERKGAFVGSAVKVNELSENHLLFLGCKMQRSRKKAEKKYYFDGRKFHMPCL